MLNTAFEPWPSFTSAEADAVSKVLYPIKSIIGQDKSAVSLKRICTVCTEPSMQLPWPMAQSHWIWP